jgi:hypothetical protein
VVFFVHYRIAGGAQGLHVRRGVRRRRSRSTTWNGAARIPPMPGAAWTATWPSRGPAAPGGATTRGSPGALRTVWPALRELPEPRGAGDYRSGGVVTRPGVRRRPDPRLRAPRPRPARRARACRCSACDELARDLVDCDLDGRARGSPLPRRAPEHRSGDCPRAGPRLAAAACRGRAADGGRRQAAGGGAGRSAWPWP